MKRNSISRKFAALIVGACVLSVTVSGCNEAVNDGSPTSSVSSPPKGPSKTTRIAATYPVNLADLRVLAGFSSAIFVGTVANSEQRPSDTDNVPWTEHTVKVSEVLKGADRIGPGREVSVWQQGGLSLDGTTKIVVGNDEIAEQEQTLLFSVTEGASGRLELIPVYGDIPLFTDEPSNTSMLQKMRQAVSSQIPYKGNR